MTSITIAPAHVNLPIRVPNLMPFNINHTGPAPVSTYFRIRPVPLAPASSETHPTSAATLKESESQPPNAKAAGTGEANLEDKGNGPVVITSVGVSTAAEADRVATAPTSCVLRPGPIQRLSESAKRFISSFRGRTVHGVDVALPKGYTGIILRGDADGDERQIARCKTKRWPTWQVRGKPMGGSLDDDTSETLSEDDRPVRTLKPAARFDSFVLWHPDIPVDEGKDEYLRSLSEWVNIAAEIHQSECLST